MIYQIISYVFIYRLVYCPIEVNQEELNCVYISFDLKDSW